MHRNCWGLCCLHSVVYKEEGVVMIQLCHWVSGAAGHLGPARGIAHRTKNCHMLRLF